MIKSMTGFGRHKEIIDGRDILCEVKSVNSRYQDMNIKISKLYSPLEDRLKKLASKYISRGKLDIYVSIDSITGEKINLSLNKEYLESYVNLLKTIKDDYSLESDISLALIAMKNEIFVAHKVDEDLDSVWNGIERVATQAFEQFVEMRKREGEKLKDDIIQNLQDLERFAELISIRAPKSIQIANERMKTRISELMNGIPIDEDRLLTECAVFADKADINEELIRLLSHFTQLKDIFTENKPVGRKLDFLVQEINREINTIGSKANDGEIAKYVIDAKCSIERIREQIQNIE